MRWRIGLFSFFACVLAGGTLYADIVLVDRTSRGVVDVFAGSNGATFGDGIDRNLSGVPGQFSFSEGIDEDVDFSDQFSAGAATSSSSLSIIDNVFFSGSALNVTALRTSSIFSEVIAGSATASSGATHNMTVRFRVQGGDASYRLTGDFNPGLVGETIFNTNAIRLTRPGTGLNNFNINTPGTLDEEGTLLDGRTYEFLIRMTDDVLIQQVGNVGDISSVNLQFSVTSAVPEPSTVSVGLLIGALLVTGRRRRRV